MSQLIMDRSNRMYVRIVRVAYTQWRTYAPEEYDIWDGDSNGKKVDEDDIDSIIVWYKWKKKRDDEDEFLRCHPKEVKIANNLLIQKAYKCGLELFLEEGRINDIKDSGQHFRLRHPEYIVDYELLKEKYKKQYTNLVTRSIAEMHRKCFRGVRLGDNYIETILGKHREYLIRHCLRSWSSDNRDVEFLIRHLDPPKIAYCSCSKAPIEDCFDAVADILDFSDELCMLDWFYQFMYSEESKSDPYPNGVWIGDSYCRKGWGILYQTVWWHKNKDVEYYKYYESPDLIGRPHDRIVSVSEFKRRLILNELKNIVRR